MKKTRDFKKTVVVLDREDIELLDKIAEEDERSRSYMIRKIVRKYLENKNDKKKTSTT